MYIFFKLYRIEIFNVLFLVFPDFDIFVYITSHKLLANMAKSNC